MSRGLTVQDRLLTLDKTMATTALKARVLPVLAGWGYNTPRQRTSATRANYTVLVEPASLTSVLATEDSERLLAALAATL